MIKISAKLKNGFGENKVSLETNGTSRRISIAPKAEGFGSSANGGELLFLSLATCFCNDVYREAKKRNIKISNVEVEVNGEFGAEGEPAKYIEYDVKVAAETGENEIFELIKQTDQVSEIQNTIRLGIPVVLKNIAAISVA